MWPNWTSTWGWRSRGRPGRDKDGILGEQGQPVSLRAARAARSAMNGRAPPVSRHGPVSLEGSSCLRRLADALAGGIFDRLDAVLWAHPFLLQYESGSMGCDVPDVFHWRHLEGFRQDLLGELLEAREEALGNL